MTRRSDCRREWLHPKWYTANFAGFTAGAPYRDTRSDWHGAMSCADCGATDLGSVRLDPEQVARCWDCHNVRYPMVAMTRREQVVEWFSCHIDNAYFHYCSRYGKRVQQDA